MKRALALTVLTLALVFLTRAQEDSAAFRAAQAIPGIEQRTKAFEEFTRRFPESKLLNRAYDVLFELHAGAGDSARAVRAASNSLALLAPDARMSPYNRFAYALAERNMALDSALAWVDRAIEIAQRTASRNLFAYQDTKAYILYRMGKPAEAESLQLIAIRGHEDDPDLLGKLALYQHANGKHADALATGVKALYFGAGPEETDQLVSWLNDAEKNQGRSTRSAIVMSTLRSLFDTLQGAGLQAARSRCAVVMADLGVELDTARQWAEAAVRSLTERTPLERAVAYRQSLAFVLSAQGNEGMALAQLRMIESLADPYEARFWLTLGTMYERTGDSAKAEEAYVNGLLARNEKRLRSALENLYARRHGSLAGLDERLEAARQASSDFDPGAYGKSRTPHGKVVLAELFTGAECGPCVSSDLAFDKLAGFYPRTALAIVEYHVHIPGPDPMTTDESWDRYNWYHGQGTPTAVIDGRESIIGGGVRSVTRNRFGVYRYAIEAFSDEQPGAQLAVNAVLRNDSVHVQAHVRRLRPTRHPALYLALVERSVKYTGANGIAHHAFVVRRMFDGANGISLDAQRTGLQIRRALSLADVEQSIRQYLDNPTAQRSWSYRRPFTGWRSRPEHLERSNLALVAWVQDRETKEVLQAQYVELQPRPDRPHRN